MVRFWIHGLPIYIYVNLSFGTYLFVSMEADGRVFEFPLEKFCVITLRRLISFDHSMNDCAGQARQETLALGYHVERRVTPGFP